MFYWKTLISSCNFCWMKWEAQRIIAIRNLKIRNWNHLSFRIQMLFFHKLWHMFCSLDFNLTNFILVFRFSRSTLFIFSIKFIFSLVPLAREFLPLLCRNDYIITMHRYRNTSLNTLPLHSRFTMHCSILYQMFISWRPFLFIRLYAAYCIQLSIPTVMCVTIKLFTITSIALCLEKKRTKTRRKE